MHRFNRGAAVPREITGEMTEKMKGIYDDVIWHEQQVV